MITDDLIPSLRNVFEASLQEIENLRAKVQELEVQLQVAEKDSLKFDQISALLVQQLEQFDANNPVLDQYHLLVGNAHKCAGCGKVIYVAGSFVDAAPDHRIYFCVDCTDENE